MRSFVVVAGMGVARTRFSGRTGRVAAIHDTPMRMMQATPHAEVQQQKKRRDVWNGELHVGLQAGQAYPFYDS